MYPSFGSFTTLHPYDIPGVRRLAAISGVSLRINPSPEKLQQLFGVWGSQTAFIENAPEVARALQLDGANIPNEEVLDLLEGTGSQDGFNIRTLRDYVPPSGSLVAIATGATARWMEYRVKLLVDLANSGHVIDKVFAVASDQRPCNLDSEVNHPAVQALTENGQPPVESDVLKKLLLDAQFTAEFVTGKNLEPNVAELMARHPELAHARICLPTNGNATYIPLAFRRFVRQAQPSFDDRFDQFWLVQRGIPLARTSEQAEDTMNYQRPLTAFSGLVRLMNELYLLQNG